MRTIACVIGALRLLAGTLAAQTPGTDTASLTLADARTRARATHPGLEAARQAVAAARARERQARAMSNPVLAYSREQTSRDGERNWQNIVTLEQSLEIGGGRGARRLVAARLREAAEARLAAAEGRIIEEVARSYAAAVASGRRARLAAEAADAFGTAARVSRARLAGGDISGYQHRRIRLEAARYAALRIQALVARDSSVRALGVLIGLQTTTGLALVDTVAPPPLNLTADSLVRLALAAQPEFRAAELELQAAVAETKVARAERVPTPAVSGGYKSERSGGGAILGGFVGGISLPLPVWDRRGGAIEAAQATAAQRTAELEALRRQASRDVRAAFDAHQAIAGELTELSAQLGEEAHRARQAADAAYAEGEIGLLEWLDSVRAYYEAEAAYEQLRAEYIMRRAALERATGAEL